jgi:AcrR family transcriptional regulator
MRKREATKSRNRSLLVDAGRRVFAKKGYDAARITDITAEAGLAAGTFYKYFEDKLHLFRVIVDSLTPIFRERLREARRTGDGEPPEAWVRRGFAAFLDIVEEYPELVKLFLIQGTPREVEFAATIQRIRGEYEKDLTADLESLAAAVPVPKTEVELLTRTIVAMTVDLSVRFLEDPVTLREPILHVLTHLVIGGVTHMVRQTAKGAVAAAVTRPAPPRPAVQR